MAKVEIDEGSGFCFGVVTAINKAEEELSKSGTLYCLGDIVHNSREVEHLSPSTTRSSTACIMPKFYCGHTANHPKPI